MFNESTGFETFDVSNNLELFDVLDNRIDPNEVKDLLNIRKVDRLFVNRALSHGCDAEVEMISFINSCSSRQASQDAPIFSTRFSYPK